MESKTVDQAIADIKAVIQESEEEIAYLQRSHQQLIDELWDLENPDDQTQTIEDAIDSQ